MTKHSIVKVRRPGAARPRLDPKVDAESEARVQAEAQALETLRRSEQRFRAIVQHSRDLIIVCSREGRIELMSSAIEAVAGVKPESRVGSSIFERLHPEDAARARVHIGRLVMDASRGVTTKLELRLAAADGGWRWIECTAANLLEHPAVNGIVLNCRDVTDRKQAEAAVAAADARLDTALRTSRTAYWSIDVAGDRVTMSPHFFVLTAIERAQWEAERHPWWSRVHPEDFAVVHRAYEDCLAGAREFYECEYRLRTPAGWMWLHDRGCIAERDAEARPTVVAGTSQDAGWRKRMEEALHDSATRERRRLNDELHDGLGQELSGIQFMLAGVATRLRREASPQADDVELSLELVRQALASTRALSRGLEPANPKNGGLRAALQQLAADQSLALGVPVRFDASRLGLPPLADGVAEHLCRMAREALEHAGSHGGCKALALEARALDSALELCIEADGPGLAADVADPPSMFHRIAAYRARAIGAQLHFEVDARGGTLLRVRYPLAPWQDPGAG